MDDKIKEALTRQVEKEPFAKKFGLKLLLSSTRHSRVPI